MQNKSKAELLVDEFMLSHYDINFVMAKSCVKTHIDLISDGLQSDTERKEWKEVRDALDYIGSRKQGEKISWEAIGNEFVTECQKDINSKMITFTKFLEWLNDNYETPDKIIKYER